VHICRPEDTVSLANIEARLDRLEAQLKEGIPAQAPAKQQASPEPARQYKVEAPASQSILFSESNPFKPESAQEAAPWADLTPPPEEWSPEDEYALPPQEEIVKIAPKPDPKPEPKQEKAAPKPPVKAAGGSSDPGTIWREAIANIPNMFVQALAREAVALHFEHNTLTVGFTDAQETKHKNLNAPINFEPTQRALQMVKPDAKLVITTAKAAPASGQAEELAKALFGDKLTIE